MTATSHGRFALRHLCTSLLFLSCFLSATQTLASSAKQWQGPYLGVFTGGSSGNNHTTTYTGAVTDTSYFQTSADINAVNSSGSTNNDPTAAIIGIQAGHDWMWNQLVYGVVFDYSLLPLNSSNNISSGYPDNSDQYSVYTSVSTNWLFTLRGKLGYAVNLSRPSLFYLTGGLAETQLQVNNSFTDNSSLAGAGGTTTAKNKIGATIGAGFELALTEHTSLELEYLYIHIPHVKATSTITNTQGGFGVPEQSLTSTFTTTGQFHASLLKVGLNYRFEE